MKEYLASMIAAHPAPLQKVNAAREYLQARILACLQAAGAMIPLAFHGGTSLRFLFTIARYSEDLDFALERPGPAYDFRAYLKAIKTELSGEGYEIEVKVNDQKTVHGAFVRFKGLLHELGLSPHQDQVLSIKIEVDTNPPAGAGLTTTVIRRHLTILQLQHHDRASLLAGKLHAILQRPYVKGRDIYDLFWYLSDPQWPEPNLTLLCNALQQTGWTGPKPTVENWRELARERLEKVAWERVVEDVGPFLEESVDVGVLTRENVMKVVNSPHR
jgi:predicted nucleotidyltransferase component of viral defense system